jgi:hypothetical protein
MHPDRDSYEMTIRTRPFRPIAMSIFASGAISPEDAVLYIAGLSNIRSIVFGASSFVHILETKRLLDKHMPN